MNICTITSTQNLQELSRLLNTEGVDIVLLQEVAVPAFNFYGYSEYVNIGPNRRGTALLWRSSLPLTDLATVPSGRAVAATFGDVRIVNVYAPSGKNARTERNEFFAHDIAPLFAGTRSERARFVVGGDFNCVQEPKDTTGAVHKSAALEQLVKGMELSDAWRILSNQPGFTYHSAGHRSRLDRVYVSKTLGPAVKSAHHHTVTFGDHQGVSVHVNLEVQYLPRGPSYWKAARHTFGDPRFKEQLSEKWKEWAHHQRRFADAADWWEFYAKPRIQSFCKYFAKQCRQENKSKTAFFMQCLTELYAKPHHTPEDTAECARLKKIVKEGQREDLRGAEEASKSSTPCGGEEPGMFTLINSRKQNAALTIQKLQDIDGNEATTQEGVTKIAREHYAATFAAPPHPLPEESDILNSIKSGLSEDDRRALAAPLTKEEVVEAVKKGPRNKSPGQDGLPAEFYRAAWEVIGDTLVDVLNVELRRGRLSDSQLTGIMVFIPKTTKPTTIKHYRPITLLNADYKILARCLAARISAVVAKVVHPMAVLPGGERNITASLCDLRDVVAYHDLLDEPGCLVSADIEGAFNNVRHDFLYEVMVRMGFGADFVNIMRTVYSGGKTRVQVNGYLSKPFTVDKSVRQGCPLSMINFILVISPLIQALYARLNGVRARDAHFVATAYADDVTVLVRGDDDVLSLRSILAEYKEVSGLSVNEQKTVAIALGPWDPVQHPLPYRYVDSARVLGVIFAKDIKTMSSKTWATVTGGAVGVLGQHKHRKLNVVQRVWFAQTYCLSKLWYVSQVLPIPDGVVAALNKAVGDFVWSGSYFRVPFRNLCSPRTDGGLGLLHPKWKSQALFMGRWMATVLQDTDSFASVWLQVMAERWPPNDPGAGPRIPDSVPHYKAYHRCRPAVPLQLQGPIDARAVHRGLYDQLIAADPPPLPRAHRLTDRRVDWPAAWRNISRSWHGSATRTAWYLVVHDLVPTNERLHKCKPTISDRCARCGAQDTLGHRLVSCGAAADVWAWLNRSVARLGTADAYLRPDRVWRPAQLSNTMQWVIGKIVRYLMEEEYQSVSVPGVKTFLAEARSSIDNRQKEKYYGNYIERLPL